MAAWLCPDPLAVLGELERPSDIAAIRVSGREGRGEEVEGRKRKCEGRGKGLAPKKDALDLPLGLRAQQKSLLITPTCHRV